MKKSFRLSPSRFLGILLLITLAACITTTSENGNSGNWVILN